MKGLTKHGNDSSIKAEGGFLLLDNRRRGQEGNKESVIQVGLRSVLPREIIQRYFMHLFWRFFPARHARMRAWSDVQGIKRAMEHRPVLPRVHRSRSNRSHHQHSSSSSTTTELVRVCVARKRKNADDVNEEWVGGLYTKTAQVSRTTGRKNASRERERASTNEIAFPITSKK